MIKLRIESPEKEVALDLIRAVITAEIGRLEVGLESTRRRIQGFEQRYKVSSETFLRDLSAEDLSGGDQEYVEWVGELKLYERLVAQLDTLRDIHYAA